MGIRRSIAKDLDADTLRCLLWLVLQRHGGTVTFTRKEIDTMPLIGEILVSDTDDQIVVRTNVKHEPAPDNRGS